MEVMGLDATPWMKCNEHAQKAYSTMIPHGRNLQL